MLHIGPASGFTMIGCCNVSCQVEGVEPNVTMVEYRRNSEQLVIRHGCSKRQSL